ncbi:MAG TPA: hypothetical protein VM537_15620 [Anaerolineae bacterium]|nr:hypothetical protein [Anaerolineae bacterium]
MAVFDAEGNVVETSYTRPANTTAYTANDAMSDSTSAPACLTFSNCARRKGGSGFVLGVTAISGANQTTLPQLTLYIFDTSVTATNDNSEFNLGDADAVNLIGSFQFTGFEALDETSGANGNAKDEALPVGGGPFAFRCGTTGQDLYGLVKVENAYTPVSGEVVTFRLHLLQD